jgi:hypothetical protein
VVLDTGLIVNPRQLKSETLSSIQPILKSNF